MFENGEPSLQKKQKQSLLTAAFAVYILVLCWLVFFKGIGVFFTSDHVDTIIKQAVQRNFIQRLYQQIREIIYIHSSYFLTLLLNLIVFIPLGLFLPIMRGDRCKSNAWIAFCITLSIEFVQFVLGFGGLEIMDMICNTLGFVVGNMLYRAFRKQLTNRVISCICLIVLILFLPFTVYIYYQVVVHFEVFLPCFSEDNFKNLFQFQ